MICTKCGREIANNSKFCTFCGENVEPKPASEPEVPKEPEAPEEPKTLEEAAVPKEPGVPVDASAPNASPISAAPKDVPQGFPPPSVTSTATSQSAPQSQAALQGFPPPSVASTNAPQGFPPPGGPQGTYQGVPQDVYQGVPTYQPIPPAPKKKKTGIIIAIVVAVLLLCVAVTAGGLLVVSNLIDQSTLDSLESSGATNLERHSIDNNNDSSSNDGRGINRATGDDVLLDTDELTITVDLDSRVWDENFGWYQVWCTVENKSDTMVGLYFDYDTNIDGLANGELEIVIFPDTDDAMFASNTTTEGVIAIFTLPPDGILANLEGTLVVFDFDTFEIIGEYPVKMAKL